jgi:hypothetical protein
MNKTHLVKGYGHLHVTSVKDGTEYRLVNRFLTKLCTITMKNAYVFCKKTGYPPFYYAERQFHSVLCPALFEITKSSLMEVPLDRKMLEKRTRKVSRRRGWVDYTCKFGSPQVDFFLEIKHAWMYWATGRVTDEVIKKWRSSIYQSGTVKREVNRWCSKRGAIRVALMFVIHYYTTKEKDAYSTIKPGQYHNTIKRKLLYRKPNWGALFIPEKKLLIDYEKEGYLYPAISCFGFAYKIQRF